MNTLLSAHSAQHAAVDILFTNHSTNQTEQSGESDEGRSDSDSGSGFFGLKNLDVSKLSIDVNQTQRPPAYKFTGNPSLSSVNLIDRIVQSAESLWRNPVRARVAKWGRREVMHVFNGFFHQSITDYERYETFGRCYTCPDPFRNDDPPWIACFCR